MLKLFFSLIQNEKLLQWGGGGGGGAWERTVFYSDGHYLAQHAIDFSSLVSIIVLILFTLFCAGPNCTEVTPQAVPPHCCLISPSSRPSSFQAQEATERGFFPLHFFNLRGFEIRRARQLPGTVFLELQRAVRAGTGRT